MTCNPYLNQGLKVRAIVRVVSYSLNVRTEDGQITVTTSGEVPDGIHYVNGHDDGSTVHLSVERRGLDGRFVSSVGHSHGSES